MKTRYLILYLLLLVVPSLWIAGLSARWQRHEQERLHRLAQQALVEQAAVVAGHLDVLLEDITGSLLAALQGLPLHDPDVLNQWCDHQPLVRHVYVWHPERGILHPDPRWASSVEKEFFLRYDALFSGRRAWPSVAPDEEEPPPAPASPSYMVQRARGEVARQVRAGLAMDKPAVPRESTGWLPWFWEREVHLLGWIRSPSDGAVRGLELESLALKARFQPFFGHLPDSGIALALFDHNNDLVAQTGHPVSVEAGGHPVTVAVSRFLPHWHVRAVSTRSPGAAAGIALHAGLLTAILLVAILSGGGLLLWQGCRHYRTAMQKTTFVSNVSHELKTPLTTIRLYAEMLCAGRVGDETKRAAYYKVMAAESRRLTRLVNNVLDFSRLEQRRKDYRRERIALDSLVRAVVAAHADRFREAGLPVRLSLPDRPVLLTSDRDAVEQVLLNLLDNAAKYAASGGAVDVEVLLRADTCVVRVADRGPGVPREHRSRIFKSFYRVDDSLTASVPGAGLGLSIGRRLLRDLGGDLCYQPREGGGAVFEICLPREPDHAQDTDSHGRG